MPFVQCTDAELYYEESGGGQPIVFLHGMLACLRFFEPQLTGLSGGYRPVAIDFRGHGRSEKTDVGHTVNTRAMYTPSLNNKTSMTSF